MAFTPFTKPTDTIQSLSDRPNQTDGLTAAQLKIKFDQGMIDTKDYITGLLAELASTTSTSGASNIGNKTITGIVGNDLQTTLEALKVLLDLKSNLIDVYSKTNLDSGQLDNRYYTETELINGALDGLYATLSNTYTKAQVDAIVAGVILGQIGDGSITDIKLSNAVGDIKERLASSLADLTKHDGVADDTGVANAYVITLSPIPTAYAQYQTFKFKAKTANTGASTLNVNGLGAKTIKKNVLTDLTIGDILANQFITVVYNGTNFEIMPVNQQPDGAWERVFPTDVVVSSAVSQVIFDSMAELGYKGFRVKFEARNSAAISELWLRLNDDVGGNYPYVLTKNAAGSLNGSYSATPTSMTVGEFNLPASTDPFSFGVIEISNEPTHKKSVIIKSCSNNRHAITSGQWSNTTAKINKISLIAASGNIAVGSIFSLWGCK